MAYIEMKNSTKLYHMGSTTITANDNVSFTIEQGELAIILGASGAGKSTVLNILGGMDTNTSGQVIIDGKDISNYTPKQLTAYRRTDIGFVFQFYNLVANLTARENVELASQIVPDAQDARQALADVGLADRVDNFPAQLSGGEQRVWRSLERWRRIRRFCCVTNRPARLTTTPASKCSAFCRT